MSRGWESKSVESQMEDAASERQSLELSRTRVLNDLAATTHPRRREQLLAALSHLDQKLAALDQPV